jgi:hypothetical protein
MSVLAEQSLFIAAAALTMAAFIQTASPQISGSTGGDVVSPPPAGMGAPMEMRVPANAAAVAADKKAETAMTNLPNAPLSDVDRKAAAAMSR